tara:strand:+ start:1531 stop:2325 length:795 start_codon:yes stop_codon:yes gene_type:complete
MVTSFPNRKYKKEIDDITNLFITGIERENIKKDATYDTLNSEHRSLFDDLNNMFSSGAKDDKVHICSVCAYEIKDNSVSLFDTAPVCARCANDGFIPPTNIGRSSATSFKNVIYQKPTYDDAPPIEDEKKKPFERMKKSHDPRQFPKKSDGSKSPSLVDKQMLVQQQYDSLFGFYEGIKSILDINIELREIAEDVKDYKTMSKIDESKIIATKSLQKYCKACGNTGLMSEGMLLNRPTIMKDLGIDVMNTDLCQVCKKDGYLNL